jgi:[acyl-carrier-protein] S-malonyltransferase
MTKIAFLFPGQGSQAIGMGLSLAGNYPEVADIYRRAEEILGWQKAGKGLIDVLKEGPEDTLRQTEVAQPALYVTGYSACVALRSQNIHPSAVAGHSIGEYAALAEAGVFSFEDGLRLVQKRSELMKKAGRDHPGTMAAILGLSREDVSSCCAQATDAGVCVPVNFNSPEQIVIAGEKAGVEKAMRLATEKGAKRVVPLNVSGAFHSPLMREAADMMRAALQAVTFKDAQFPVAMNVDGRLHTKGQDILDVLAHQLDSPVQWLETLQTLKSDGFGVFVECGSGRVLSGLVKKIDRQLTTYSTETAKDVQSTITGLIANTR